MTVEKLHAGLAKLEPGGWSLTVNGYAKRTLKIRHDLSAKESAEIKTMMHGLGLEHRRVPFNSSMADVWDYQK